MEDGNGIFYCRFRCHALDALYHNAFGFLVGSELGLVDDFVDVALSLGLCFGLHVFDKAVACLFRGESAELFEFLDFAFMGSRYFRLAFGKFVFLLADEVLLVVKFLLAASDFLVALADAHFALFEFVLLLCDA